MQWDVFCRVIDNYGDIGVSWRLAADLASRGERVRLWLDDARALQWMAPDAQSLVQVIEGLDSPQRAQATDVVIETFGCELPARYLAHMASQPQAPVWINLEYLSAEPYVRRCHGLRSPQFTGPAAGLTKWFFYPGVTEGTGGLLREPGLMDRLAAVDRSAWLSQQGWAPRAGERVVVVFSYEVADWPGWLQSMAEQPTLLLVCPGAVQSELARQTLPNGVRAIELPWFSQTAFDILLCCADVNLVRGEDSLVRALWAGRPFVWQIYRQSDGAHEVKLAAFMGELERAAPDAMSAQVRSLWLAWNGLAPWRTGWPELASWDQACVAWRAHLLSRADLCTQLKLFVAERR
jgi:uncharacterized repeat protein (TIGR03837 family)